MDTSLEDFLEEMVSLISERLRKQEKRIDALEKKFKKPKVDRSVMKVLSDRK
jgi:hypothetical protein